MRVLFATLHPHPPERYGGSESTLDELADALARRGHRVAVLAGRARRDRGRRRGQPARDVLERLAGRRRYALLRRRRPAEAALPLAARLRPDVAVVQAGRPVPLARALLRAGVPTLLYVHDVEFDQMGGPLPRHPSLSLLANSAYTAKRLDEVFGVDAPVVPPLVAPARYAAPAGGSRVLFVNPHPLKGVDLAFALAERRPDVPFVFLESWDLGRKLRRRLAGRAASLANVQWHPPVRDMRPLLARTRLLLVPSRWQETWGRVVTEAQVSGIPALVAARGGLPETLGPGGLVVAEDDAEAWVEAFAHLWDDPAAWQRASAGARSHAARDEIAPERVVAAFVAHLAARAAGSANRGRPLAGPRGHGAAG